MIEDYLNQTGYRVLRAIKTLYDDDSAATLTLTGTAPEVNYRLRITLSGDDCAGTITINGTETLTFTAASTKTTTTTLTANSLPTVTTTNLSCNILIECIDVGGSPIYEETALELYCRFQDTQKAFMDPTGKWTNSSAVAYTDETSCNIGTTFSYDGYDYNIAQVSIMTDLDGAEEGRKLYLTGKTLSPDRPIEVEDGSEMLIRYMVKAMYDVDEDGIVDRAEEADALKDGATVDGGEIT